MRADRLAPPRHPLADSHLRFENRATGNASGVARPGNGTLATIIERCRACREACQDYLTQLDDSPAARAGVFPTLRCVAFLTVISDTLEAGDACPTHVIDTAIELARELPDDLAGCAEACRAAADMLSEWLDGGFEHR